ncbi:hypothetical protein SAMN05660284_02706 [Formivibrio citricus]|uniref:Lipoprotein n=1 Tax=Formivibrio citricus TaxID=83765 RepID=A0A1I5DMZ1_9NEIS|nr:DUF799 domain-containing protein [Formivibrio citricus]SFO00470.1 hypothetical protein SAMN05660284_02706 [Formivibrio citricus]
MNIFKTMKLALCAGVVILASGCATQKPYDYTAFKQSRPKTILVLPPVNNSPDVNATYSMLSHVTYPLAESGYYVLPVTLVDETFRQNGIMLPAEMHAVTPAKLREIFGADAALYITIQQYGVTYMVVDSEARVTAQANLVDLKTGKLLWSGSATASNNEGNNNSGGGVAGILISAVVKQIVNNVTDAGHGVAGVTSQRLLFARPNGLLLGPRSPNYGKD